MAKRRNKNKVKLRFAGLNRNVHGEVTEKMFRKDVNTKLKMKSVRSKVNDPREKVQVTEKSILTDSVPENKNNKQETAETEQEEKLNTGGRKTSKNTSKRQQKSSGCFGKHLDGTATSDEMLICPTEIDGETCIEIQCGNNEAHLYLSKLCLGSKGACIHYADSWLTPNEFQTVSGRETAKDWKRSIRHKGRSLKMLISKGLITAHNVSLKKTKDDLVENLREEIDSKAKSPKNEIQIEAAKDEKVEVVVGGINVTLEKKKMLDTKAISKKRGRKYKKLKQKNAPAKIKTPHEKMEITDNSETSSSEILSSLDQTRVDETKLSSEICDKNRDDKPETTSTPLEDTQTKEDQRLDEFVKSLRLTKAVAPKLASGLSSSAKVKDIPESIEDEEPEMPVLQKEAAILPTIQGTRGNEQLVVNVNVDTFHASVTPPPTPPAGGIIIDRKTDDEKLIETFKSRLASPSNGLKLTINREKVKVMDAENKDCENISSSDVDTGQNYTKTNIQSVLLQDALLSAKKYKEKLKQNTPPSNLSIQVLQMNVKPGDSNTIDSPLPPSIPSTQRGASNNKRQLQVQKQVNYNIHRDQDSTRRISQPKTNHPYSVPNNVPSVPSMEDMDNLAGMSFQEFLDVMSSIYGPLPFPVDTKDAAFAALQEMNRRHDMLRLITQGYADGSSSSFFYPVMTQQILLAMTQQLYNLCNIPGWLSSTKPSKVYPKLQTSEIKHKQTPPAFDIPNHRILVPQAQGIQYQNDMLLQEIQHRRTIHSQEVQKRRISPFSTVMSLKKRKQSEAATDCALDLSVKRQRVDSASSSKLKNVSDVNGYDAPLDFSMKKTKCRDQCHNKELGNTTSVINGSVKTDVNFDRQVSVCTNAVQKSSFIMCTCDSPRDEDITSWSVERVCYFLRDLDGCAPYAKTFHEQGISGRLLPYLTTQHLTRTLGMKVGPAITLMQAVERKFKERTIMPSSSPCQLCRKH
ncbi:uncharacterized protein LOC123563981 [Mercenaria mercenaria]|uniref:uncharacterized protein LOC123563981 n=1 Tax=Mercenaria mercenaria TaxID=6596 RepID=UPI00234F9320|nr:uncharacterized protein LOC123563981 [Mercenaria mercenaria]